jgi:Ca2+-binding EF-hand superfamily protein
MFRRSRQQKETESGDSVQASFVFVDTPPSRLDMERVRKIFGIFDSDKDGSINKQQLLCALHSLGYKYRIELLCTVINLGDTKTFDLHEFEGFARKVDEAEMMGLKSFSGTGWVREAKD